MRVERDVESIVTILGNVKHTRAEVLSTGRGLLEEYLEDGTSSRVINCLDRLHESSN